MRMVIQRVKHASVTVDGEITGKIGQGFLVLLGIGPDDTEEIVEKMADKMMRLRIFSDENDKINRSLSDVDGELLLVSQFTLYAGALRILQGVLPPDDSGGGVRYLWGGYAGRAAE